MRVVVAEPRLESAGAVGDERDTDLFRGCASTPGGAGTPSSRLDSTSAPATRSRAARVARSRSVAEAEHLLGGETVAAQREDPCLVRGVPREPRVLRREARRQPSQKLLI